MKYKYKTNRINFCTEKCSLRSKTMIGSGICKRCDNCVDFAHGENIDEHWIECREIEMATKKELSLTEYLDFNGFERSHDGTTEILDNGVLIYPFYQGSLHDHEGNKIETIYQFTETYKKDLLNEV